MNDRQTIAQLSGAVKTYGRVTALAGVDLDVRSGEVVAVLGPNGAGKTTAVQLLLGLIRPTRGSARLFGREPRDTAARVRVGTMRWARPTLTGAPWVCQTGCRIPSQVSLSVICWGSRGRPVSQPPAVSRWT